MNQKEWKIYFLQKYESHFSRISRKLMELFSSGKLKVSETNFELKLQNRLTFHMILITFKGGLRK